MTKEEMLHKELAKENVFTDEDVIDGSGAWDAVMSFAEAYHQSKLDLLTTQLKGDKYTQAFNDYVDRFFKYRPKVYDWVSKDGKREFTHTELCKFYTKAMNESPLI